jgi:uncharacterized protein YjiS (DUF1127 family)
MFNKIVKDTRRWMKQQERINRTRRELSLLTDRDLNDIGISRCDIDRVARENSGAVNVAL